VKIGKKKPYFFMCYCVKLNFYLNVKQYDNLQVKNAL